MNKDLLNNNYLVIPNFFNTTRAIEYGKALEDQCKIMGVEVDPDLQMSHNKDRPGYLYAPFTRTLLSATNFLSCITQIPLLPTYSYARVYKQGNTLPQHSDRESCEVSVTLCLAEHGPDWPIYFTTPSKKVAEVCLHPGDAVVYLGMRSVHWRNANPVSDYAQVFFHYVNALGPHADRAFEFTKYRPLVTDNMDSFSNGDESVFSCSSDKILVGLNRDRD